MSTQDENKSHEKYSIANMQGIKSAITNGEEDRVKQLLADQTLDELQKSYLIDLAHLSNHASIVKLLEDTPSRP